jgi:hypothetical protein
MLQQQEYKFLNTLLHWIFFQNFTGSLEDYVQSIVQIIVFFLVVNNENEYMMQISW